jgi:hypothetical protein
MQPKWIDAVTIADQRGYQQVLRGAIEYARGHIQLASGFSRPVEGQTIRRRPDQSAWATRTATAAPSRRWSCASTAGRGSRHGSRSTRRSTTCPPFVWVLWIFEWDAPLGDHTLEARATYTDGGTQFEGHRFPYSGGIDPEHSASPIPVAAQ